MKASLITILLFTAWAIAPSAMTKPPASKGIDDAWCQARKGCSRYGWCTARWGRCWTAAKTDADCRRPHGPRGDIPCKSGLCAVVEGVCAATTEAMCGQSQSCHDRGRCGLDDHRCRALKPTHCERSKACRVEGECTPSVGFCEATRTRDCLKSEGCRDKGACGLDRSLGMCAPRRNAHCRKTSKCQEVGHCSFNKKSGRCGALTFKDCAGASICKDDGMCIPIEGHCSEEPHH